jgi:MoaA/NifB/PqqE/SkfB family radical SAM enzyme
MIRLKSLVEVAAKGGAYHLARLGIAPPPNPIVVTFSVTAACQSLCKTCRIGKRYRDDPGIVEQDLTLDEIERIFSKMGPVLFFNVSGGEPFLRRDLPSIIELACRYLRPRIVHIPTNGILAKRIPEMTVEILDRMERVAPGVPLTVKPSIDGVGEKHDEIRGCKGNWERLVESIEGLQGVSVRYPRFHLELGTVISRHNVDHLDEIADFVHSAGVQSYRNEIAERRAEFFNKEDPITPDAETYERLIGEFARRIRKNLGNKRLLAKMTESLRLEYYELVVRILRESRQVIPCLAGLSNVHINFDGEVWPCCVLGYDKPLGDLRQAGLDFQRVWRSPQARRVRKHIADGRCACPLANQAYSNILFHPPSLARAGLSFLKVMASPGAGSSSAGGC